MTAAAPINISASGQPGAIEDPATGRPFGVEGSTVTGLIRKRTAPSPSAEPIEADRRPDTSFTSADPSDDQWAEPVRHHKRQPLPDRDQAGQFGVERVQIWHRLSFSQAELINERLRLKSPVAFEGV
jgi:hypothetical protein